jgi:hypothetical protein
VGGRGEKERGPQVLEREREREGKKEESSFGPNRKPPPSAFSFEKRGPPVKKGGHHPGILKPNIINP